MTQHINRYEIKAEIGRGGMATVYHAHDPNFDRDVAIKVLPREFLHDSTFLQRFEREARVIARLEHAAIVPVYDFGQHEGQPFLVMRYMGGGSLADRLRQGAVSLGETAHIVARLAPALDKAHAKGIVHRDLKPGNILFDEDGEAFISDFGIARIAESTAQLTGSGAIVGTPAYMSPEQARARGDIDGRADLYSVGVIIFQMLAGKLPYQADTPVGYITAHITEPVPDVLDFNPALPPACEAIVKRAMAKQADDRYSTASELAADLEAAAASPAKVRAISPPPTEPEPPAPLSPADVPTMDVPHAAPTPAPEIGAPTVREATPPPRSRKMPAWVWIGGAGLGLLCGGLVLAGVLGGLFNAPTPAGIVAAPTECATANACAVFAPGEPIRIGFGGPMTGDGEYYGIDASQAAALALQDAGEFNGHAFVLVAQDDLGTPDGGAAVASRFAADPTIVAVVGHAFSGASAEAIPIYTDASIPMMSPTAANPTLTQDGNPVFNRVAATDAVQGERDASFLYDRLGVRRLAILHDGEDYSGQNLAQVVGDEFQALGGEVVAFEAIIPGETDYSAALYYIADMSPDAVFYGGYTDEFAAMVNQRASVGLGSAIFMSGDGVYGSGFIDLAGGNAEGVYASSPVPPESAAKAAFDQAYLAHYGVATGSLTFYSWYGYDAAMVIVEAIKKVAIVTDDGSVYIPRAALVAAVRNTSGYQGITGEITCDATGECATVGFTIFRVESGEWVEVSP